MSSKAELYRQKAAHCEEQAKKIRDPTARRTFEDAAREWRELAEQVERHGLDKN